MRNVLALACAAIAFVAIPVGTVSAQDRVVIKRDGGDRADRTIVRKRIVVRERRPGARVVIRDRRPSARVVVRERRPGARVVIRDRRPSARVVVRERRPAGRVVIQRRDREPRASVPTLTVGSRF